MSRTLRAAVFSRVRNGHWKGVRLRDKVGMTAGQCYVLVVTSKKVATSQIAGARAESLCIEDNGPMLSLVRISRCGNSHISNRGIPTVRS